MDDRARRIAEAVEALRDMCGRYPEIAKHIRPQIELIVAEADGATASDGDLILSLLERGCTTVEEIVEEQPSLTAARVRAALEELREAGLVSRNVDARRGAEPFKPQEYFVLMHDNPFDSKKRRSGPAPRC